MTLTQDERIEQGKRRAAEAFASLTPEQQADVLTFRRALADNLGNLLGRTFATDSGKHGRVLFNILPPAPGEECTIPELRKAGLIS